MASRRSRRRFLQALGRAAATVGAASAGWPVLGRAQPAEPAVEALHDGLARIGGTGGNVVVLETGDGLALVDSGSPGQSGLLLDLLAGRYPSAPVRLLLNTHWHLDHTGANQPLAEAGATILAHENTRLWMSTEFYVEWEDRRYPPRPPAARPTDTFHSSDPQPIERTLGGRRILCGHLRQAHTDGDIYVRFPESNVIVAGGTVTDSRYPVMDYITGGWIGGLIDATTRLIDLSDDETLIVPGAGSVQRRADLEAQREMLEVIRERIEAMAVQGKGAAEMLEEGVTRGFDARWGGDADLFIRNVYEGLWWGNRLRGVVA